MLTAQPQRNKTPDGVFRYLYRLVAAMFIPHLQNAVGNEHSNREKE